MTMRSIEPSLFAGQRSDYGTTAEDNESISILDRFSNFDGTFHSSRDLRIEGQAKGTIECQGTLHIAQGATIDAKVEAENIVVAGDLDGQITCRGRLQILPSGRVRGTINTQTLVIHEGAFYEGQLEMTPPERQLSSTSARRTTRPGLGSSTTSLSSSASAEPAADEPRTDTSASTSASSTPAASGGSTFIRRLGGQETSWEGSGSTDRDTTDEES